MKEPEALSPVKKQGLKYYFALRTIPKTLRSWLSDDIGFATLPLLLLAGILKATSKDISEIGVAPEWSFAAIVLFGASIRRIVDLSGVDRVLPIRFHFLQRVLFIPLILSTTTFTLATLSEYVDFDFNIFLYKMQIALFVAAVVTSFFTELIAQCIDNERRLLPEWISKFRYYRHLEFSLRTVEFNIEYTRIAVAEKKRLPLSGGEEDHLVFDENKQSEMFDRVSHLQESLLRLQSEMEESGFSLRTSSTERNAPTNTRENTLA